MIEIPFEVIVFFGFIAVAREAYNVFWVKKIKNVGSLFTNFLMFGLYAFLAWGDELGVVFHGSLWVRAIILLMFLDKAVVFFYEIREYRESRKTAGDLWKRL